MRSERALCAAFYNFVLFIMNGFSVKIQCVQITEKNASLKVLHATAADIAPDIGCFETRKAGHSKNRIATMLLSLLRSGPVYKIQPQCLSETLEQTDTVTRSGRHSLGRLANEFL